MKKILICLFFFLISLSSCSKDKELKIGVIGPMKIKHGEDILNAVRMAADKINKEGGILGREIVLIPIDDENKADTAAEKLKNLIETENISIITGGFNSSVVLRSMEVMADKKILWLGTGGAHPDVIKKVKDNYERYKYYFRVGMIDALKQGEAIANFAVEVLKKRFGYTKFAVIGSETKYATEQLELAKNILLKKGFTSKYIEYFPANSTDFSNYFKNAIKTGAEFILTATPGNEALEFIKQYHELKVPIPFIGALAASLHDEWWKDTNGNCLWETDMQTQGGPAKITPKTMLFAEEFKKLYGRSAGFVAYCSYDTLFILKEATKKTNSLEMSKIIPVIEHMEYEGNILYKFIEGHDLLFGKKDNKRYADIIWFQWKKDGKRHCIWPEEFADAEYELPDWIK